MGSPPGDFVTGLTGTHFWDCSGAGCDSTILQPWNPDVYVYASPYAPLDPQDYGGSVYGESLWMTGAPSAQLAELLGPDDSCCGADNNDAVDGIGGGGCGKCVLVRNPSAISPDTTAVVMKKSFCPAGDNSACDLPKLHMGFAVPGFDNLQYSTANICGASGTIITQAESSTCGTWYDTASNAMDGCDCSPIPDTTPQGALLRSGCNLFRTWGWTSGSPDLEYQVVDCPAQFVNVIENAFTESGPASLSYPPPPPSQSAALSGGAVGGIVVGCSFAILCAIVGIALARRPTSSGTNSSGGSASETKEVQIARGGFVPNWSQTPGLQRET